MSTHQDKTREIYRALLAKRAGAPTSPAAPAAAQAPVLIDRSLITDLIYSTAAKPMDLPKQAQFQRRLKNNREFSSYINDLVDTSIFSKLLKMDRKVRAGCAYFLEFQHTKHAPIEVPESAPPAAPPAAPPQPSQTTIQDSHVTDINEDHVEDETSSQGTFVDNEDSLEVDT